MYTPSPKTLRSYAHVLTDFALNGGSGIKRDEVVLVATQVAGLPLARQLYRAVLHRGGHPILQLIDDECKRMLLAEGTAAQVEFFPRAWMKGMAATIDHWVRVRAEDNPTYLKGIDPSRIMAAARSARPFREWLDKKEDRGEFTWTLCLYGTEAAAAEAGMSIQEYWRQIRRACYLDTQEPIGRWQQTYKEMNRVLRALNRMPIDRLHLTAEGTDLWISVGNGRQWLGGRGRNIPSFEIFTSPDWRGTHGTISFDLPLYRHGNIIKDITLRFEGGVVVEASAGTNESLLREMIRQRNADKVGEFSMTDRRFSRITRFMANTLYDENFGGRYGNTHIALGKAYHQALAGDRRSVSKKEYARMGFNESVEHCDIIASTPRTVTAHLAGGSRKILYKNGVFVV